VAASKASYLGGKPGLFFGPAVGETVKPGSLDTDSRRALNLCKRRFLIGAYQRER
jgi:hypothetical protein